MSGALDPLLDELAAVRGEVDEAVELARRVADHMRFSYRVPGQSGPDPVARLRGFSAEALEADAELLTGWSAAHRELEEASTRVSTALVPVWNDPAGLRALATFRDAAGRHDEIAVDVARGAEALRSLGEMVAREVRATTSAIREALHHGGYLLDELRELLGDVSLVSASIPGTATVRRVEESLDRATQTATAASRLAEVLGETVDQGYAILLAELGRTASRRRPGAEGEPWLRPGETRAAAVQPGAGPPLAEGFPTGVSAALGTSGGGGLTPGAPAGGSLMGGGAAGGGGMPSTLPAAFPVGGATVLGAGEPTPGSTAVGDVRPGMVPSPESPGAARPDRLGALLATLLPLADLALQAFGELVLEPARAALQEALGGTPLAYGESEDLERRTAPPGPAPEAGAESEPEPGPESRRVGDPEQPEPSPAPAPSLASPSPAPPAPASPAAPTVPAPPLAPPEAPSVPPAPPLAPPVPRPAPPVPRPAPPEPVPGPTGAELFLAGDDW